MRSLNDLGTDALKVALDASDALMRHKAYLPPGGLLVMLLGQWPDDIRGALGMERDDLPGRGKERRSLDELTSIELDTVSGAATILLQDRFTGVIDDPALPKLLGEFHDKLGRQKAERKRIQASIGAS